MSVILITIDGKHVKCCYFSKIILKILKILALVSFVSVAKNRTLRPPSDSFLRPEALPTDFSGGG
jgi:hypothetical protein